MAEFEELRLTVNLVDNASTGLVALRAGLGDLTKSTDAMTVSLTTGVAAITNLGTATTNAAPQVRTIAQASRDAARSANELKDGFMRMNVATQGLSSLPAIAGNVRDLGFAVHGLGSAFSLVGAASSVAVVGIAAVAVAVVGLGAVMVAYGVSVFKFAGEMEQLGRTAKQMGLGFAQLKYATDQAKQFGYSADTVIRSYQGIQAAQLDLYKNNSQLRATLLGQGVDAGWIAQLSRLDPNQARSAIIKYSKQLEAQALASGAMKGNAARLKAQFLKEFGLTVADADMPELKPPTPEKAAKLAEVKRYSDLIMGVWRQMTHEWTKFKTELLASSLPVLRDSMIGLKGRMPAILKELKIWIEYAVSFLPGLVGTIPTVVKKVGIALKGVISLFQGVITTLKYMTSPWKMLRSRAHPKLQKFMGWDEFMSKENELAWEERRKAGNWSMWDAEMWGGGSPTDEALRNHGLEPVPQTPTIPLPPIPPPPTSIPGRQIGPGTMPHLMRRMSYSGGDNDNNPLLSRVSFTQTELKDEVGSASEEMAKLTRQLERLNDYIENTRGGGGGSRQSGIINASLTTGDIPAALGGPGLGGGGGDNTPLGRAFAAARGGGSVNGAGQAGLPPSYTGGQTGSSTGGGRTGTGGTTGATSGTTSGGTAQQSGAQAGGDTTNPPAAGDGKDPMTAFVKGKEGWEPVAKWDAGQYSVGYGTKAKSPTERITREEAESRLQQELGKARASVEKFAPNAPQGVKDALTSLTYNAGAKWQNDGLGKAIQSGNYDQAKEIFKQYNKSEGKVLPGLASRRMEELGYWDKPGGAAGVQPPRANASASSTGPQAPGTTGGQAAGAQSNIPLAGTPGQTPKMGPSETDPRKIPYAYQGTLEMEGESYRYGEGGRQKGALPPGSYNVNIGKDFGGEGDIGPVGKRVLGSIATVGGLGGEVNDPRYPGQQRAGIQIHKAVGAGVDENARLDQLYSAGCIAIHPADWPKYKAHLLDMAKRTPGGLRVDIGKDGKAQILARGTKIPMPGDNSIVPALAKNTGANDNAPRTEASDKAAASASVPDLNTNKTGPGDKMRPGPTPERAALERDSLTRDKADDVKTDGKLKADVTAPPGTKVEVSGSGAFKNTETSKSTTISRETANQLLKTG